MYYVTKESILNLPSTVKNVVSFLNLDEKRECVRRRVNVERLLLTIIVLQWINFANATQVTRQNLINKNDGHAFKLSNFSLVGVIPLSIFEDENSCCDNSSLKSELSSAKAISKGSSTVHHNLSICRAFNHIYTFKDCYNKLIVFVFKQRIFFNELVHKGLECLVR